MGFIGSASRFASTVSAIAIVVTCSSLAYLLSGSGRPTICIVIGAVIGIAATIIASRIWGRHPFNSYTPFRWLRDAGVSAVFLGGFLLIDILVGVLANPELPIAISARMHAGFVVTLFVSPVALVPFVGGLRAFLLLLMEKKARSSPG